ncbi:MAG: hypothetical protein Q7R60_00520 [bacterium]|nr:hypothetical protein [bacterium]
MSQKERTECIYPISPRDEGRIFVIRNGYDELTVADSAFEVTVDSANDYFASRTRGELAELKVHPALASRPDFISGVVSLSQVFSIRDAHTQLHENYDRGIFPYLEELRQEIGRLEHE